MSLYTEKLDSITYKTSYDLAIDRLSSVPDAPVFREGSDTECYRSIIRKANRLGGHLKSLGLKKGDVVSFQLPNWIEAAIINLACCKLGLIVNPIVPIYRAAELEYILPHSDCRVLFVPQRFKGTDYLDMVTSIKNKLNLSCEIISVRSSTDSESAFESIIGDLSGGANDLAEGPGEAEVHENKLLLYTSGTTGRPKGVLHTHTSLARALYASALHWNVTEGQSVLMPSPVTHITGYSNALEAPFLLGTHSVLMDSWDPRQAVELIDQYQIDLTVGATPFLRELLSSACELNTKLDSLKIFACGGATVPAPVIEEANDWFSGAPVFRVYGSTEAPYISLGKPGAEGARESSRTDGQVVDYDLEIVSELSSQSGRLGDDSAEKAGEVAVRGGALFNGYWRAEEDTTSFTADGFFLTGDIARCSAGSVLTIIDRKKDLIIRGGENISASEIEEAVILMDRVKEVAVVSFPHSRLGEGVCAFVVTSDSNSLSKDEISSHMDSLRFAKQKIPEMVFCVDTLPRTVSGKIRKDVLREMASEKV